MQSSSPGLVVSRLLFVIEVTDFSRRNVRTPLQLVLTAYPTSWRRLSAQMNADQVQFWRVTKNCAKLMELDFEVVHHVGLSATDGHYTCSVSSQKKLRTVKHRQTSAKCVEPGTVKKSINNRKKKTQNEQLWNHEPRKRPLRKVKVRKQPQNERKI